MVDEIQLPCGKDDLIHRLLVAAKCPTSSFGRACAAKSDDASSIFPNRRD